MHSGVSAHGHCDRAQLGLFIGVVGHRRIRRRRFPASTAASTLSQQIDQHLAPVIPPLSAAKEEDGALLRRLSLDLRGVVPTKEELDAFAADTAANRWTEWVDKFLQDPLCDEHLVTFLDRTLMLRRGFAQVDRAVWISYLRDKVAANTPLDTLTRELLFTPWWNRDHRAAQRFYLDRGGDPHLITRDLARVFLGRDLQCAQCHDHPLVEDFRQVDYHGLLAFVSAGSLAEVAYKDAEDKEQKVQLYIEKAAGDAPFESVFERGTLLRSGTRLDGQPEQIDEYHMPDSRYLAKAPEGAFSGAPIPPQSSRREQLAQRLASRENPAFVSNWANRLWALVYGRGLVHPVDMNEPDNPPSHPELYREISDGLLNCDMQIKKFLRELVIAQSYQRGGDPDILRIVNETAPTEATSDEPTRLRQDLESQVASLNGRIEALAQSEATDLEAYERAREAWLTVQSERTKVHAELDTTEAAMMDAKKKNDEAGAALAAAQKKLTDWQTRLQLLTESAEKLEQAVQIVGGQDESLTNAATSTRQLAEAARGQVPELEKGVSDSQSASTTANDALQQATSRVKEVVAKLQPVQESLLAADRATVTARTQWQNSHAAEIAARRRLVQVKHLAQWLDANSQGRQLVASIASLEEQIAKSQGESVAMVARVQAARDDMAALQQEHQTIQNAFNEATRSLEEQQRVISALDQTVSSIADATRLVSRTEPLQAAQDSLREEANVKRTQLGELQSALDSANAKLQSATNSLGASSAQLEQTLAAEQQLAQQLTALQNQRDQQRSQLESVHSQMQEYQVSVLSDAETQYASAGLYALTAEQLGLSTLRVTGVLDAYIRTEIAELEKQSPLAADADEPTRFQRTRQAVRQAIDKLRGNLDQYVSLYASGPDKTQDDFFASADQALYVANGGAVFNWAAPGNNNPTQVAIALTDAAEVAKALYWAYLCRQPSDEEVSTVAEQLATAGDQRNAIIQEMAWSLLASAEFRFTR